MRWRLDGAGLRGGAPGIAGLLGVLGLVAWFSYANRAYELDDALIYFRYLRNALDGHGLVWNPGERHNGLTSPLYTWLSLFTCAAAGSIRTPMWIQASVLTGAALAALYELFRRHERHAGFVLLGIAIAAASPYTYSVYGLETPLFLLMCAGCLWLWDRGQMFALGIASALLILTRGEGALLVAAMAAVHVARGRPWPRPRDFALPAALLLASAAFHQSYYGSFLPETAMAKIHQGRSGQWGDWPFLTGAPAHLEYFAYSNALFAGFAALALLGAVRLGRRDLNLAVLIFLGLLTLFYVGLRLPEYHWYYAPHHAFAAVYAGVGGAFVYDRAARLGSPALARIGRGLAAAAPATIAAVLAVHTGSHPLGRSQRELDYRLVARWLRQHTPPTASIAMIEVGIVGYYSERRIVDILGVVSPGNARALGDRRFGDWLPLQRPDFILLHHPPTPHERRALEGPYASEYARDPRFRIPGYALLARR